MKPALDGISVCPSAAGVGSTALCSLKKGNLCQMTVANRVSSFVFSSPLIHLSFYFAY